jgi:pimeloyl-ACP methyl ester carboxylesterase
MQQPGGAGRDAVDCTESGRGSDHARTHRHRTQVAAVFWRAQRLPQRIRVFFNGPLLSPEYTPAQVGNIDKGSSLTLGRVLTEFVGVDLTGVTRFPIPIVMFMGRHDYTTPTAPTVAWMAQLQAPYNRTVWFEHSAHLVPWEEPGKLLVNA